MKGKKTEFLQIRISKEDKALIKAAAKSAGEDMSQWILNRILSKDSSEFLKLTDRLADNETESFYIFAQIHDFLASLSKKNFMSAVDLPPNFDLSGFKGSYLAAMIEERANQLKEAAPEWTERYGSLEKPHFGTNLKGLRLHLLANSPPPFRKRNIFIDSTVGARV